MYQAHPSQILSELFERKPYQGADPQAARFLFVGLDANYAANIEANPIFPSLIRYHEDGAGFWRESRVHHPFLLPQYTGDRQLSRFPTADKSQPFADAHTGPVNVYLRSDCDPLKSASCELRLTLRM